MAVVELNNVSKKYGSIQAMDGISFSIPSGVVFVSFRHLRSYHLCRGLVWRTRQSCSARRLLVSFLVCNKQQSGDAGWLEGMRISHRAALKASLSSSS